MSTEKKYYKNKQYNFIIETIQQESGSFNYLFEGHWLNNEPGTCLIGKVVYDPNNTWGIGKESIYWVAYLFEECSKYVVVTIENHYWCIANLEIGNDVEGMVYNQNGKTQVEFDIADEYDEEIENIILTLKNYRDVY